VGFFQNIQNIEAMKYLKDLTELVGMKCSLNWNDECTSPIEVEIIDIEIGIEDKYPCMVDISVMVKPIEENGEWLDFHGDDIDIERECLYHNGVAIDRLHFDL